MNTLFEQDKTQDDEIVSTVEVPFQNTSAPNIETDPQIEPDLFSFSSKQGQSKAEAARMGGLAWSIGFILFGAVVLMMLIGWGADLIFGTQPWGMICGLILGAVIGFIQLFRTSSEIFRK